MAQERSLPLHAVGRAAPWPLVACSFLLALAGWLAAACVALAAAGPLASGYFAAGRPLLAMHLLGLVFFPFAVAGAAWHVLPVMLRNDLPSLGLLWLSLPLLGGGVPLAVGVATGRAGLTWTGAALIAAGLAIVLFELAWLVARAPKGKMLVASRAGVALSGLHVLAAFVLGAMTFAAAGPAVAGVPFERMVLVHLTLAGLGWLTLLVLAVGRTLAPMLALAPAAGTRRFPHAELALAAALWLLLAGIASGSRPLAVAGGLAVAGALAPFGAQLAFVVRRRRLAAIEGPLAHLLVGAVFLLEAGIVGLAGLLGAGDPRRAAAAFAILLLAGWAGGVTVGHLGKLLSLSAWGTWPPGPRPRQAALYPRLLWGGEAALFAAGAQLLAAGALAGSAPIARAGAATLVAAALLALVGALTTVERARLGRRG